MVMSKVITKLYELSDGLVLKIIDDEKGIHLYFIGDTQLTEIHLSDYQYIKLTDALKDFSSERERELIEDGN